MGKNLRIVENREWIIFPIRGKEKKEIHRTASIRKWRRQRLVTSNVSSAVDGLLVNVDNLSLVGRFVLQEELSLIEANLPELLQVLDVFQEEEE
jgi:hypothetical protein